MGFSNFRAPPSAGGMFVRLQDGDAVRFILREEWPLGVERSHWLDGRKVDPGTEGAELSVRWISCIYDVDAKCPRVLRVTKSSAEALAERTREFGYGKIWRIKRVKTNGKVSYIVDMIGDATPEQLATVAREQVIDVLSLPGVDDMGPEPAPPPAPASFRRAAPAVPSAPQRARPGALPREPGDEDDIPF